MSVAALMRDLATARIAMASQKANGAAAASEPLSQPASAPAAAQAPRDATIVDFPRTEDGTPMILQNDSHWGSVFIGNSSTQTIGQIGCALASIAMMLSRELGRDVTPLELNEVFKKSGAFVGGGIFWQKAMKVIEDTYKVTLPIDAKTTEDDAEKLTELMDARLAEGKQMLLHVDTDGDGKPNHWVLLNRKEGEDYVIVDPSLGKEYRYRKQDDGSLKAVDEYYPKKVNGKWVHYAPKVQGYISEASAK